MKDIAVSVLTEKELAVIEASTVPDLRKGDILIREDSYGNSVIRVTGFEWRKHHSGPHLYVLCEEAADWNCTEWDSHSAYAIDDHYFTQYSKLTRSVHEYVAEALEALNTGDIAAYDTTEIANISSETALLHGSSKEMLLSMNNQIQVKRKQAELLASFMGREMYRRKSELQAIRTKLNEMVSTMKKQVSKIMAVVATIELYLGINEDIFQLQEGPRAGADVPITLRQQVLYADEEYGSWIDGGIDFSDLHIFDKWITTDENYKRLLPEEKGVVCLKPRRNNKDYGSADPLSAAIRNAKNRVTYILIRNGDALFRLYSENLAIHGRFFPQRKELEELMQALAVDITAFDSHYEGKKAQEEVEQAQDTLFAYKKRAVLVQGLIDRSEVFYPLPAEKIDIFNIDENKQYINFVYDDELTLSNGRLPFKEWQNKINAAIEHGSRIILAGAGIDEDDIFYYVRSQHSLPDAPNNDVYEVEVYWNKTTRTIKRSEFEKLQQLWDKKSLEYKVRRINENQFHINYETSDSIRYNQTKKGEAPIYEDGIDVFGSFPVKTILYKPGGEIWSGGWSRDGHYKEREKRVRYNIETTNGTILNYDQLDITDIEFYMNCRIERKNYLSLLPLLETLRNRLREEIKNESFFVEFVTGRNVTNVFNIPEAEIRERVIDSVSWWKYKNKWKRAINKDDALALRMIEKRILSKNYDQLKDYEKLDTSTDTSSRR